MTMPLPLLDRTKFFRGNIHQKQSVKPVFDIMFYDSLMRWNQIVTFNINITLSYHSLAWDLFIFPLSHNLCVYCDVSVVARDKRVNMNDATQKHLHSAWLPLSHSLNRTDEKYQQRRYFPAAHLSLDILSIIHIFLIWFTSSPSPNSKSD